MPTKTGSDVNLDLQDVSSFECLMGESTGSTLYAPAIIPVMLITYKFYSRHKSHVLEMAKLSTEKHKNILEYKLKLKELDKKAETSVQSNGGNQ